MASESHAWRSLPYHELKGAPRANLFPIKKARLDKEMKAAQESYFTVALEDQLRAARSDWKERCQLIDDRFKDEVQELVQKFVGDKMVSPWAAAVACSRLGFTPAMEFQLM